MSRALRRAVVRPRASPQTPSANLPMASRRDRRDHCRPAVLALAGGRRRGGGSRTARAMTTRQDGSRETHAQAAQETGLRTRRAGDGQVALLRRGQDGDGTVGSPRAFAPPRQVHVTMSDESTGSMSVRGTPRTTPVILPISVSRLSCIGAITWSRTYCNIRRSFRE